MEIGAIEARHAGTNRVEVIGQVEPGRIHVAFAKVEITSVKPRHQINLKDCHGNLI
jgi:hypothetical protein